MVHEPKTMVGQNIVAASSAPICHSVSLYIFMFLLLLLLFGCGFPSSVACFFLVACS